MLDNEDNFSGKSAADLKKLILNPEAPKPVTEEKKEIVSKDNPSPAVPAETAPKTEELLLGKFKSQEDLVKAYQELEKHNTKVSQELSQFKTTKQEPVKTSTDDYLYSMLFGQTNKNVDKVSTPVSEDIIDEPVEDARYKQLQDELEQGKRVLQYLVGNQTKDSERKRASEKFKNDPLLPWSDSVEQELEEKVFSQLPQLKFQQSGYEYAYKLLKADKADEIAMQKIEAAAQEALKKREKNETAVVETPTKSDPEPEFDPAKVKDVNELRKYIKKQFGELER